MATTLSLLTVLVVGMLLGLGAGLLWARGRGPTDDATAERRALQQAESRAAEAAVVHGGPSSIAAVLAAPEGAGQAMA